MTLHLGSYNDNNCSYFWTVSELMTTQTTVETHRFGSTMKTLVMSSLYGYMQHRNKTRQVIQRKLESKLSNTDTPRNTFCLSFLFLVHPCQWLGWKPGDSFAAIQEQWMLHVCAKQNQLNYSIFFRKVPLLCSFFI